MRLLLTSILALVSCVSPEPPHAIFEARSEKTSERSDVHHYFSKVHHERETEWGYSGSLGPENWGSLSPEFRIAEHGKQQSPIDLQLKDAAVASLPPLRIAYQQERVSAVNNGHTIQHNERPGSFLHVGDSTFGDCPRTC